MNVKDISRATGVVTAGRQLLALGTMTTALDLMVSQENPVVPILPKSTSDNAGMPIVWTAAVLARLVRMN